MKIIALDSSGLVASVAIVEDQTLIGEYNIQYKKTHSQTLLPMLNELKNMVELDLTTVDAIALAAGPGSFTGLRIGSATAKGLCLAMNKPIIEIPTLDGLACNLYGTDKLICPIMDARRNQVYTGIYEFIKKEESPVSYRLHSLAEQCAVSIEEIAEKCNAFGREVIFLGDGVPVFEKRLSNLMTVPYGFAPAHMNRQRAAAFGILAEEYYKEGKTVAAAEHAPEYLRLSQAEREKTQTQQRNSAKEEAKLVIRELRASDAEAVSRIEQETFSMPWSIQDFLEMTEADYAHYYVAEAEGEIAGCCGVRNMAGEGEITNVVVAEKFRQKGIGRKMLEYMLKEAPCHGIGACTLEVRVSNTPAIRLYESLGFKGEGIRPGFYERPKEDALIMWKR